jgi:WhiB family redox-sensing transcriptional regulator
MDGRNDRHLPKLARGPGHPLEARSLPTYRPRAEPVGGGPLLTDRAEIVWLMTPGEPDVNEWFAQLCRRPWWHSEAACRGTDPSTFVLGRGANAAVMARARAICDRCTVSEQCLDFALADPDAVGVWAGTTGTERRLLRRDATDPRP